jgi:hypothetical protein
VFVGPQGATPKRGNFRVTWNKAVEKAGVPGLHFHDLRHTGNTLAAEGASLRELMARMGHNSAGAALVYQHASRDREQAIGAAISARIVADRSKAKGHDRGAATGSRRKGPKNKRTRKGSEQGVIPERRSVRPRPGRLGLLEANLGIAFVEPVAASQPPAGRRAATLDRYWSVP